MEGKNKFLSGLLRNLKTEELFRFGTEDRRVQNYKRRKI